MNRTAHVAIGNSDDKLTQERWSTFVTDLELVVLAVGVRLHGTWSSMSTSVYQNACVAFEIEPAREDDLRAALSGLRLKYGQEAIALNLSETEHIV